MIPFWTRSLHQRESSNKTSPDYTGSEDDPACHFPENEACCDCKSEVRCITYFFFPILIKHLFSALLSPIVSVSLKKVNIKRNARLSKKKNSDKSYSDKQPSFVTSTAGETIRNFKVNPNAHLSNFPIRMKSPIQTPPSRIRLQARER